MPVGAVIGGIGALGSVAGAASNIFGGGGSSSSGGYYSGSAPPPTYIPQGQSAADTTYQNLYSPMAQYATSIPQYTLPIYQNTVSAMLGNPYTNANMQNALLAQGQYGNVAAQQAAGANTLQGLGQGAATMAGQIYQTGFDPQSALYNRTQQQIQDQANAVNAMYGLASSPYGAGVANLANQNFNIDWQNQQLARQAQAAQAYGGLTTTSGRGFAGASDLGAGSAQSLLQAGATPYNLYQGLNQNNLNALAGLNTAATGAFGLDQNTLNALAAYMKLGQSATGIGQAGAAQQFGNNQAIGQGFGTALSQIQPALSQLFGPGGVPDPGSQYMGTYGNYSPVYSTDPLANQIGFGGM